MQKYTNEFFVLLLRIDPMHSRDFPQDFAEKVKAVHENGGDTGSIGYIVKRHVLYMHGLLISACYAPPSKQRSFHVNSYKYNWKIEEAEKNILRTHTTAISARMLYHLGQQVILKCSYIQSVQGRTDRAKRDITLDGTKIKRN